MKVGDLVRNLYPGKDEHGIVLQVITRDVWGIMYRILWTHGETEYMTAGDVEVISEGG